MAVSLPRYLSLSVSVSSGTTTVPRFMEVVYEDAASPGLFIGKGEKIMSPFSKLELVDAGSGRVHIRSGYNNKYLAVRSETDHRISPVADEQVEDQSAWSCTLFRVTAATLPSGVTVWVQHVQLGRNMIAREPDRILQVDDHAGGAIYEFAVHDISAMLALNLPQFISLRLNGLYGGTYPDLMRFGRVYFDSSVSNIDETTFEILPIDAGSFRFRSLFNNKCWRVGDYSIVNVDTSVDLANLPADHHWSEGLFNLQRNNDDLVSFSLLRSGEPHLLVCANLMLARPHSLGAPPPADARFVLEEAVKSRKIYNVKYNVLAARILTSHPESISTQTMDNGSSVSQQFSRTFTYSETSTTSWSFTVSLTVGVSTTVSAGIPFVADASVTVGGEFSGAYDMGKEYTNSVTKEDKVDITVPPGKRVSVSRWESKGSYDLPYSYTQEDVLYTGKTVVLQKPDGLAVGINNYDIFYNVVEEPLDPKSREAPREYRIVPVSSRIVPDDPAADDAVAAAE